MKTERMKEIDRMIANGEKTPKEILMEIGQNMPKLTLEEIQELEKEEMTQEPIGKFGKMFRTFMEEEYSGRVTFLIAEGRWAETVRRVNREAKELYESLTMAYERKNPRPTESYMDILQHEQAKQMWAEEIVLMEIVYRVR